MKITSRRLCPWVLMFLLLYLVINLVFLTRFPFVHSDESWLSGLARNMDAHNDFGVTEPFFDLKERHPHALKIVFHSLQSLAMKVMGYNIFSMRLISLIFSLLTLYYVYRLAFTLFPKKTAALAALLMTAFDVQYIYASHFARQEIILVFFLVLSLYVFYDRLSHHVGRDDFILGSIVGLSIGIHPNSFIISLPSIFLYGYHAFFTRRLKSKDFLRYLITLGGYALFFIVISLSFDPNFLTNYSQRGSEFGVFNSLTSKLGEFKLFYQKIYHQISGTYYTPNIKLQFFLFPLIILTALGVALTQDDDVLKKDDLEGGSQSFLPQQETITGLVLSIVALNVGIILVGRYNQTSIIFQFPLFYLLTAYVIYYYPPKIYLSHLSLIIILLSLGAYSVFNITPYLSYSYDNYLSQINKVVHPHSKVLANLNTEYYFDGGQLLDFRNLAFLQKNGLGFEDYVRGKNIRYIIYPEEMDLIYKERPRWNGMYGAPHYYEELKEFLDNKCTLIYQFTDPIYAMRIVEYMGEEDWRIWIYQVK